eukprot:1663212-Rhodomonas_salina.3
MPASVHTALISAPDAPGSFSAILARSIPRILHPRPRAPVHFARVDLEDVCARALVGVREFNFAVDAARADQRVI